MTIKDLSPPAMEPLDLAYAKTFLRVDHHAEDSLISDLIVSARTRVEKLIRASLITRRQTYTTSVLSDSGVYINHGPVSAVHGVKVIDRDGSELDVSLLDISVDLRAIPARLCLREPLRWSQFGTGAAHLEIELDAGYGLLASHIPMPLRQAVMLLLAQSYEHRNSEVQPPIP